MNSSAPKVVIVEQPSSKGTRFRYECEGRYNNNIHGASGKNSFPTIRILNYRGPLSIFVSCVTKDPPHAPHPHKLASGDDSHNHGICFFRVPSNEHDISFQNLCIQCTAKKNVIESLEEREKAQVDPYKTGFKHKLEPKSIDLSCVRLCFQVILESGDKKISLDPVVTEPIYNKKHAKDLKIAWISHKEACTSGGVFMVMLCDKVSKNDIEVRFYNEDNGWEATADDARHFKQVAIAFKSPEYKSKNSEVVSKPVNVKLQLRRVSNGETSPSIPFRFLPMSYGCDDQETENMLKRKRDKFAGPSGDKCRQLQAQLASRCDDQETENMLKRKRDKFAGPSGDKCRQLQAQVASHPDFKNLNRFSNMNKTMEPGKLKSHILKNVEINAWELPPKESVNIQQQVNTFVNVFRERSSVHNSPTVNQHNNIQPTIENETSKTDCEEQEEKDATNTFSFDRWLSDLRDVFYQEPGTNNCDSTAVNKIAHEPDNNYINVTPSVPEFYDNMTNFNNTFNKSSQQTPNYINNADFLKSSIWENQNTIKTNDLNLNVNQLDAKGGVNINETRTEMIHDIFTTDELIEIYEPY